MYSTRSRPDGHLGAALSGVGLLIAFAIQVLARHDVKVRRLAIAATSDPDRKLGGVAVMGKLGDPACCALLRYLVYDPDPLMRLAVASALYRCDERDGQLWSAWIRRETDLAVSAFLSAIAGGGVTLTCGTLDHLAAQAEDAGMPVEVRAGAAWAVAQHDVARGTALAEVLLADPDAAFALASVVRRRGGPLVSRVAGVPGDPEEDLTAESVGLPRPAAS
jgi:HEAT repeat protein